MFRSLYYSYPAEYTDNLAGKHILSLSSEHCRDKS